MTRETAAVKTARLLAEGHVRLTEAGPGVVTATVRGTTAVYVVTYRRGGWHCPCAHRGRCSHLAAVMAVTHPTVTHRATDPRLSGVAS